jgi:hypothetical protein
MGPTKELIDDIYRERVLRARETPLEQKLRAGPQLFERACRLMAAGIRDEYPDATEQEVEDILTRRLETLRRLRERR